MIFRPGDQVAARHGLIGLRGVKVPRFTSGTVIDVSTRWDQREYSVSFRMIENVVCIAGLTARDLHGR